MKLTIIQTGEVPSPLRPQFGAYPPMFKRMFDEAGQPFEYETVAVYDGAEFPDASELGRVFQPALAIAADPYAFARAAAALDLKPRWEEWRQSAPAF